MAKEISLFKKRLIIKMSNRNFYSLILLGVLILLGGGFLIVNALTPGVAPNPGHLITEVAPPAGCGSGQVLQFVNGNWGCVNLPVDTDTNTWRPAQTLSVSGQTLSISSGNSVSLPSGGGSSVNVYQCPQITYTGGCYGWQNGCEGQITTLGVCKYCSGGAWVNYACTYLGKMMLE